MEKYITIEAFQAKVSRHEWYCGYVTGAGYAYYVPLAVRPEKFVGSVLLDGEFTIIWVQKLDSSPEMRMKSLKESPTKSTNLVSEVGKGLQGYNQYLRKNPHLKGNAGLPHGSAWQKNAGHSFQTNQKSLIMNKQAGEFLKNMEYMTTSYKIGSNE